MADVREFKLPEDGRETPPRTVDFDAAAEALGCSKIELTKNRMPDFIAWVRSQ